MRTPRNGRKPRAGTRGFAKVQERTFVLQHPNLVNPAHFGNDPGPKNFPDSLSVGGRVVRTKAGRPVSICNATAQLAGLGREVRR